MTSRDHRGAVVGATRRVAGSDRSGHNGHMTKGEQLLADMRRVRRSGDPRLSDADREILRRVSGGDLADEFAAALMEDVEHDEILGGSPTDDQ